MASVLTDLRDEVKDRINIGTGGAQPSDPQLLGFVTNAVKGLVGELPPVFEITDPLGSDLSMTIANSQRILFVQTAEYTLFDSEWMREADLPGIQLLGYATARPNDKITAFYTKDHSNASELGAGTPQVETSCIFGVDWLEELILSDATISALRYMTKRHGSGGGSVMGALLRVELDNRKERYQRLRDVWNGWNEEMRTKQQERAAFAPPIRRNPLAGRLSPRGKRISRLTGRP